MPCGTSLLEMRVCHSWRTVVQQLLVRSWLKQPFLASFILRLTLPRLLPYQHSLISWQPMDVLRRCLSSFIGQENVDTAYSDIAFLVSSEQLDHFPSTRWDDTELLISCAVLPLRRWARDVNACCSVIHRWTGRPWVRAVMVNMMRGSQDWVDVDIVLAGWWRREIGRSWESRNKDSRHKIGGGSDGERRVLGYCVFIHGEKKKCDENERMREHEKLKMWKRKQKQWL